ncbi:MAG: hypothetical protein HW404_1513, partial [Anaerolineales bacterium]|nr:hypothetical protein [Anaerolineales bacterium]
LTAEERRAELAQMLGGSGEANQQSAAGLIGAAERAKTA